MKERDSVRERVIRQYLRIHGEKISWLKIFSAGKGKYLSGASRVKSSINILTETIFVVLMETR